MIRSPALIRRLRPLQGSRYLVFGRMSCLRTSHPATRRVLPRCLSGSQCLLDGGPTAGLDRYGGHGDGGAVILDGDLGFVHGKIQLGWVSSTVTSAGSLTALAQGAKRQARPASKPARTVRASLAGEAAPTSAGVVAAKNARTEAAASEAWRVRSGCVGPRLRAGCEVVAIASSAVSLAAAARKRSKKSVPQLPSSPSRAPHRHDAQGLPPPQATWSAIWRAISPSQRRT